MDKYSKGFTLFEFMVTLAVLGFVAVGLIPAMTSILNKQMLKSQVSLLDNYMDKARNLATITECPVTIDLNPNNGRVDVAVRVQLNTFMKGCSAWYAQTSNPNDQGFSATLQHVSLDRTVSMRFNAISGVIDTGSQQQARFTLRYQNRLADIMYRGIGDGVVRYE